MEVDDRKNPSKQSMSPSKNALRTKWRTYCHGSGQDLMTGFKEEESLLLYNQSTGKENRICKVCNKGFSSGRALGGHMRVHTQHQQQQQQQPQLHEEQDHDLASTDILPIPNTNNSPMIRKLKLIHKTASRTDNATAAAAAAAPGGGSLNVKANVDPWRTSTTTTKTNSYSTNPSCSLCGKKFPSMKSLFGHMRCHPEREWRGIQPPPPPPPPPRPSSLPPAATPKNTSVPSTSTLSDKDSCGSHAHQQQHRVKTEIEMDDHDQLDSSLSTTARSVLSPAESLPSWSLTGKRGRKGIAMAIAAVPPPRAPSSEEPIPESDAAYHLLMLAHCYPPGQSFTSQSPSGGDGRNREYLPLPKKLKIDVANSSTSPSSRRDEEYFEITGIVHDDSINNKFNLKTDKGNSAFLALKLDTAQPVVERMNVQCTSSTFIRENYAGVSELAQGSMRQSRREEEEDELNDKTTDYRNQSDHITCTSEMIVGLKFKKQKRKKKKKKKMNLRDLERLVGTESLSNKFKCWTCNKSFTSHQALGGHRSSHKMGKSTTGMDDSAIAGDNENTTSTGEEEEEETKAKNPHRCKICSKAFRTGQALGGHQRLHRISPAEAAPPSSSEDMSKGTGRGILEFDLNELPEESMEDDDEVINSVTQHNASSSYNSVT